MSPEDVKKFQEDGYLVLPDFYTLEEVDEAIKTGNDLGKSLTKTPERIIFDGPENTSSQTDFFLKSANHLSPFYEAKAFEDGQLKMDPFEALSRIGHNLHVNPTFKKLIFNERVKDVCSKLGFEDPAVAMAMYLFKNPKIYEGSEPHQESTFLYNEPTKLLTFWVTLADTFGAGDGCIRVVPKSHFGKLHSRYVRKNGGESFGFVGDMPNIPDDQLVPLNVKKGTVIVLDGKLIHESEPNNLTKPVPAFVFNVLEQNGCVYSAENWCQPENSMRIF